MTGAVDFRSVQCLMALSQCGHQRLNRFPSE
nr:MAG TPA: hypothetical protein [Caudoviricetes sp.]